MKCSDEIFTSLAPGQTYLDSKVSSNLTSSRLAPACFFHNQKWIIAQSEVKNTVNFSFCLFFSLETYDKNSHLSQPGFHYNQTKLVLLDLVRKLLQYLNECLVGYTIQCDVKSN